MTASPSALLASELAAAGIRDVQCVFPDVSGVPRGKLMPAAAFAAGAELRIAQAIPMQCVTGEYSYDSSRLPFSGVPAKVMMCGWTDGRYTSGKSELYW